MTLADISDIPRKVAYISSPELEELGNIGTHPAGRSSRVHRLIESLDLLQTHVGSTVTDNSLPTAQVVPAVPATRADLQRYHSQEFVDFLLSSGQAGIRSGSSYPELSVSEDDESDSSTSSSWSCDSEPRKKRRVTQSLSDKFGLQDDCPPFPELADYAKWIAGSTLTAAKLLTSDSPPLDDAVPDQSRPEQEGYDIAINWEGGRHHALRDRCSGFCYVQDVVVGIDHLRRHGQSRTLRDVRGPSSTSSVRKPRVMYLDLDVHLGDAPAAAFKHPYRYTSPMTAPQKRQPKPTVMTVSVHHQSPGFFPSTPEADLTFATTPTPCTISIPLRRGASKSTYARIWQTCIEPLHYAFQPDYVVLLLGMDALAGDKLVDGAANWSTGGEGGVGWCIERAMEWDAKLLVLGGGGYHRANTARGWAIVTSKLLGRDIPEDVPSHDFWPEYSPSFQMHVEPTAAKDENDEEYLGRVQQEIDGLTERIKDIFTP